jgi:hypothetical protein
MKPLVVFVIGAVEYFIPMANTGPRGDSNYQLEGMFKKVRPARPLLLVRS